MDKQELVQTVKDMINAPSCCKELKAAGQNWLDSVGTAREKDAADALLREIKEDIATIEHVIEFFESPKAVQIFGAAKAKAMAAHAHEVQNNGGKWCDCPACSAGLKILNNADILV